MSFLDYGQCYILSSVWVHSNLLRYLSYRLRLVSISCDPSFNFSIDSHTMTVIEVEGTNVQPLVVDSLEIFAGACVDFFNFPVLLIDSKTGQRYSVVVCQFVFFSWESASDLSVAQSQSAYW